MKIIIAILLAAGIPTNACAQKMPSDYFGEAGNAFSKKNYTKAIDGYGYITEHYPKNKLYPMSFFNLGICYIANKDTGRATDIFKAILQKNFNEMQEIGGGIMDDPYANYKHKSCAILSDLYYGRQQYDSALKYLALSDSIHVYQHFCGNELAEAEVSIELDYARIYDKLGRKQDAVKALLPVVFNRLGYGERVLAQLKEELAGRKGLKQELDDAIDKIYSKTFTSKYDSSSYKRYYIRFLDAEIEIRAYGDEEEDARKKRAEYMRTSALYNMINEL